jgi:hypothetical protein
LASWRLVAAVRRCCWAQRREALLIRSGLQTGSDCWKCCTVSTCTTDWLTVHLWKLNFLDFGGKDHRDSRLYSPRSSVSADVCTYVCVCTGGHSLTTNMSVTSLSTSHLTYVSRQILFRPQSELKLQLITYSAQAVSVHHGRPRLYSLYFCLMKAPDEWVDW